jgi:hypothetical protein
VVTNADSRSFALIAVNKGAKNVVTFAKDAAHVFFQGGWNQAAPSVIAGADPETFVTLDHASYQAGFAKDAHRVYYGDQPLSGADPQSFESLAPFGKDAHAVYVKLGRMAGADPKTFTVLQIDTEFDGTDYAKDARSVYYGGQRIPGADPATFTAVTANEPDQADAKDRHHRYFAGRVINPGL